jgi:hypothetical protein
MRIIIHIKLVEEYPRYYYKDINKMLTKHFRRVNKDTFELKKGVFLKFDRDELLIYEEEKEEPSNQNGG